MPVENSDSSVAVNQLLEVNASRKLIVLTFWASWAPQCEQMKQVVLSLSNDSEYSDVLFINIEAEKCPEISQKYGVNAVPTSILLQKGSVSSEVRGVHPAELREQVRSRLNLPSSVSATAAIASATENESERFRQLINRAPLMMFIKGSPQEPRCKFTRALLEVLTTQGVSFDNPERVQTFDILSDDTVREGLKKFSNWPTYPQVYIKGELVGGLDIVKELVESGQFKSMLASALPVASGDGLESRLRKLIKQEPIMLFMKGSPDEPRCGFSKQAVALLKEAGCQFGHFDILEDEDVRQGLKKLSNWPTYPQIYVKGELVGGLDILKELKENGELAATLKVD